MRAREGSSPRRRHRCPRHIGGSRNWDYRFCWLRDATLTLLALMNAGYLEEAKAWREWLSRAAAGTPDQAANHVWDRGRTAAYRMGGSLASRLPPIQSRSCRQRRSHPTSTRRVWRTHGRAPSREAGRTSPKRIRLEPAAGRAQTFGRSLAEDGRRDLGGAQRRPPLHLFENYGVGRIRSSDQKR